MNLINPSSSLRWPALLTLALAACGGNTLDGGSATASPVSGGPVDAGDGGNPPFDANDPTADSSAPSGDGSAPFTAVQVAAAQALCDAPHGPVDPTSGPADITAHLTGAWLLCSAPNVFFLTKSVEFAADGNYYILESDGAGGLRRGLGIDRQGKWEAQALPSVYVDPGPFRPQFETGPRRMKMTVATSGFENWYVRLGL